MLDNNSVEKLLLLLSDSINKVSDKNNVKQNINHILHSKSVETVIRELNSYLSTINGEEKNLSAVITIMALLRRNLDCGEEIAKYISNYNLTGCLYGGLYKLLSGNSRKLCLAVKSDDSHFENKYEYISHFPNFVYFELIVILESARVLALSDIGKFEQLALADRSNLILLNIVIHHINIKPSDELIIKLLHQKNELKQNIAFFFITEEITLNIPHMGEAKKDIKNSFEKCYTFLEQCDEETKASLLFNYILVHQSRVPTVFAYDLMSESLQNQFIMQITKTKKIKLLKDVSFLVDLISKTPALNNNHRRFSKSSLYEAITEILTRFIEEDKGIYAWDKTQKFYINNICHKLPVKSIRKFKSFLICKKKTLMCTQFDELVRFDIYLKDKPISDIIDEILNII